MSRFSEFSCFQIISIFLFIQITKSSHVYRSQESSYNSRNNDQIQSQQSISSKPVYDTLVSIDERIRMLEAYDNTYKLTRLDFALDQLSQRISSIETKLSRIENSIESKITKLEELILGTQLKDEFRSESITRKIDDFGDKINNKAAQMDTKLDLKVNQINNKLDSMERFIHLNSEEIIEKLIKEDERHEVFESHVKSHIVNIESLVKHSLDANTNIKDMINQNSGSAEQLINTLNDYKLQEKSVISQLSGIVNQIQNSTFITHITEGQNPCQQKANQLNEDRRRSKSVDDREGINSDNNMNNSHEEPKQIGIFDGISNTMTKLQQLEVDKKLTQLDIHVDYYSRKIINAIQEIWRSTQSSESYLRDALDMANKTRSFIREEFRRLQEQIEEQIAPLNQSPNLFDIREPIEQKLYRLSTTVDDSFNVVLTAQNSFISSCKRIQEQEEQVYDVLEDMLIEIRNKSSFDVSLINNTLNSQNILFNHSFSEIMSEFKIIKDILINTHKYSSTVFSEQNECFLTRNQLISVCNKYENNLNSNINNEQTGDEKSDEKIEEKIEEKIDTNYDDLSQTES